MNSYWNFGSHNYSKSDFLRLWCVLNGMGVCWVRSVCVRWERGVCTLSVCWVGCVCIDTLWMCVCSICWVVSVYVEWERVCAGARAGWCRSFEWERCVFLSERTVCCICWAKSLYAEQQVYEAPTSVWSSKSTIRLLCDTVSLLCVPHTHTISIHNVCMYRYGVATISRLLEIIGLFCRISSLL